MVEKFIRSSKQWKDEMIELRKILLKSKLTEEWKWSLPCYTHDEKNVVIIQPFKKSLALMFFKGALLKDSKKLLVDNGPHSKLSRRFEFQNVQEISKKSKMIAAYIKEAIQIEKKGRKIQIPQKQIVLSEELKQIFKENPNFKKSFTALTPGRQRSYLLHFAGAKQTLTRINRIKKCIPKVLLGKGFNER